jgi:protein-L-isoaspartate(D-aspartate) O-methyltransferase
MSSALLDRLREAMVRDQVVARGVVDPRVLAAMRAVPRDEFVGAAQRERAYDDTPLPIGDGQTISQPYVVALMAEAAAIGPTDHVLEVGAGSGYASAVLGKVAGSVVAVEWHRRLADEARERMSRLGYRNVTVLEGDGSVGVPEHAPFDAIVVSAGGPSIPKPLLEQLRVGGTLVIPVGHDPNTQELLRVRRTGEHAYETERLGAVRFVPLVGSEGWAIDPHESVLVPAPASAAARRGRKALSVAIAAACEPMTDPESIALDGLLARIGDARVVLIGESTHGTSEFYRMRARITKALVSKAGFDVVALEADWPDAAVLDRHVQGRASAEEARKAFDRFPSWMWRNRETAEFIAWLTARHLRAEPGSVRPLVCGLDLYGMSKAIAAVLEFLDREHPKAARLARDRYSCFTPWEHDPTTYGRAAASGLLETCEDEAVRMLQELLEMRLAEPARTRDPLFDAQRNAAVVRDAERYYRAIYRGARESWNLRDAHMMATLQAVLAHRGERSRAVVWAHNSHVGDAGATEMHERGETNIGELCRRAFGPRAYLIGMGTHKGTVAAAGAWDAPMRVRTLLPSHPDSFERLCLDSGVDRFLLPLRHPKVEGLRDMLRPALLQRAVGVVYRPETELLSHYLHASVSAQFDEWAWFAETSAVDAKAGATEDEDPGTYPFGL